MSHQCIADAFAPADAAYKEKVMHHVWGHLAPRPKRVYSGYMIFTLGEYGDYVPIKSHFKGMNDSPWFFQDMMAFIVEKATQKGCIYRFTGSYQKFGDGSCQFVGKMSEVS